MNRATIRLLMLVTALGTGLLPDTSAQTSGLRRISGVVTYVTPGSVYFNVGSSEGLAIGDTLVASRGATPLGKVVISAISSSSSAAQVLPEAGAIATGDTIWTMKIVERTERAPVVLAPAPGGGFSARPADNIVSGRIAAQYAGTGVVGSSMDFSQPSLALLLGIERLFGTGLRFRVHGRGSQDLGEYYARFGTESGFTTRIYEANITLDDPQTPVGFSVGRIISPFLGGMGQFDGGQIYARTGQFSFGVAAGTQPASLNSAFDTDHEKAAVFVHYAMDQEDFRGSEITVAYGQQRYMGRFDRDFLYTQLSIRTAGPFSFYQTSEFDLHEVSNGDRTSQLHLTNVFITFSYTPVRWVSLSAGYDATRSIYLFESMKSFPDTLLDRDLQQGIRGGLTFRLPSNILLMLNGTSRPGAGEQRDAMSGNAVVRMSDVAGTGINAGIRYTNAAGVYTDGNGFAVDIDRWLTSWITVGARLDQYKYTLRMSGEHFQATTLTLNTSMRLSRTWYLLVNFDQLWDTVRDTQRVYAEISMHF